MIKITYDKKLHIYFYFTKHLKIDLTKLKYKKINKDDLNIVIHHLTIFYKLSLDFFKEVKVSSFKVVIPFAKVVDNINLYFLLNNMFLIVKQVMKKTFKDVNNYIYEVSFNNELYFYMIFKIRLINIIKFFIHNFNVVKTLYHEHQILQMSRR